VNAPLLAQEDEAIAETGIFTATPTSLSNSSRSTFSRASVFTAVNFCLAFHEMILVAPYLSLFERALCKSYYTTADPSLIGRAGWVSERYCKIPEVQRELAIIRGWKSFFDTLPGEFMIRTLMLKGGGDRSTIATEFYYGMRTHSQNAPCLRRALCCCHIIQD